MHNLTALEQRLLALMRIDSTTGSEGALTDELHRMCEAIGMTVSEQVVDGSRRNLFACFDAPTVVFTTHQDCVPPFVEARVDDEKIHGRGSCDAKGSMAAMFEAVQRLKSEGITNIGVLFVVGEETDSRGAKAFARAPMSQHIRFLINGEPTNNRLTRGHKGVFAFRVSRQGTPGHSAYPELFDSATHPLIEDLGKLLQLTLPSDPLLGTSTLNVGKIAGGRAANIVAESAEAEIIVRLARPLEEVKPRVLAALDPKTKVEIRSESNPATMFVPDGFDADIVRFGSDVPHLRPVAEVLLVGPGSIHDAHTSHEFVARKELHEAADLYVRLAKDLLRLQSAPRSGQESTP